MKDKQEKEKYHSSPRNRTGVSHHHSLQKDTPMRSVAILGNRLLTYNINVREYTCVAVSLGFQAAFGVSTTTPRDICS